MNIGQAVKASFTAMLLRTAVRTIDCWESSIVADALDLAVRSWE